MRRSVSLLALTLLLAQPCFAVELPKSLAKTQEDTKFSANTVRYDQKNQQIIAEGNVIVSREGRTLKANKIVYTQPTNSVTATGNITLTDTDNNTLYADSAEITDDLKSGIIEKIRVRFADESRLLATRATRTNANTNTLEGGAFTPCRVCKDDIPLWEIHAKEVVHDEVEKTITYHDASLEVGGVPVFYFPYFQHPDPTVKQASGFLPPSLQFSDDKGVFLKTPYYFALSPSKDLEFSPILMTRGGAIGAFDYRQRFGNGQLAIDTTIGNVNQIQDSEVLNEKGTEASILADGEFNINEDWRWGFAAQRVSDKGYLKRFSFDSADILTSSLYAERFSNNDYFNATSYAFQGLRSNDVRATTPLVLPELTYALTTTPDEFGGHWNIDASALALTREQGSNTRRLSLGTAWEKPILSENGGITTFTASVDGDGYYVEKVPLTGGSSKVDDGFQGRVVPQVSLQYRHPFIRQGENSSQLIEPLIAAVASPNGNNPLEIPNEDAQVFEFDQTNIFMPRRFTGRDRVAGGQRLDYGLNTGLYDFYSVNTDLFLGQSYQVKPQGTFGMGSGLDDNFSDFVGRLLVQLDQDIQFEQRFRLNKQDFGFERNEMALSYDTQPFQLEADYLSLTDQANTITGARKELGAELSTLLDDQWVWSGRWVRDLAKDESRYVNTALTYFTDCAGFSINFQRDFTNDPNTTNSSTVMFRLDLKHLGAENMKRYLQRQNRISGRDRDYGVLRE
jgi:LPS-assembly protein